MENLGYVDFHCHVDLYPNYSELVHECERLAIRTLAVTNAPCVWKQNRELLKNCKYVRPALGLHPELAHEREKELSLFAEYLKETRYIGEVGLDDAPQNRSSMVIQRRVFREILKLSANEGGKILSIHSRGASKEVIEDLEKNFTKGSGQCVLHWFSGSKKEASLALELGCYFSINMKMINSKRGLDLVKTLPPERILTESDGPFIVIRNEPSTPKDVSIVIEQLASLWSINKGKAARQIQENLRRLLL